MPGISIPQATLQSEGFKYDRRWMLVDEQGVFISQRTHPQLTQVNLEMSVEALTVSLYDSKIEIGLDQISEKILTVSVFEDTMKAQEVDEQISIVFSKFLNQKVQLVKQSSMTTREKNFGKHLASWENTTNLPDTTLVSFADGYPYLICGTASLTELNAKLDQPLKMNRFRPNIVVETQQAWEEDNWKKIKIGDQRLLVIKPCARCQVITINQETGNSGKEPLKTLSTFRNINNNVIFGQNAVSLTTGILTVGDLITLE